MFGLKTAKALVFASTLGASLGLVAPAANAITWNFNLPTGNVGPTESYTVSGVTINAAGFSSTSFANTRDLFGKNGGGDENGLGLNLGTDHEIDGSNLIRVGLPSGLTNVSFTMGSSTSGEHWEVLGSNSATSGYASLLTGTDEVSHSVATFAFYLFRAFVPNNCNGSCEDNPNVLLASISATPSAVPLPPAAMLFGSGVIGLVALGRRKRRSQSAV